MKVAALYFQFERLWGRNDEERGRQILFLKVRTVRLLFSPCSISNPGCLCARKRALTFKTAHFEPGVKNIFSDSMEGFPSKYIFSEILLSFGSTTEVLLPVA